MKHVIEAYKDPRYFSKRIILALLCVLHDFTKYHTARTIAEVFYWPEGLCLDMVVVFAFFMVLFLCVWDDCQLIREMMAGAFKSLIDAIRLIDDDDEEL